MKCEIITGNMPQLWEELLLQLQEQKYPSKSIRHYREAMGRVDRYMRENKISEYTEAVGDAYLATHDEKTSNGRSFYMSFHVKRLNDILNKQPYIMVHTKASQKELRYFNDVFDGFSEMLCKQLISESTRKLQKLYCYEFLHFIEQQGISDSKEINAQIIYAAFSASGSKENFGCAARKLLKYLYQKQLHPVDLTEFVPSVRRAKPMPTVYSKDEIEKLLNVVDKCTAKGLRDYVSKARRIVIPNECADLLKVHFKQAGLNNGNKNRHVFSSQRNEYMTISCVEEIVSKYVTIAKELHPDLFRQKAYTPHAFRHTVAVDMLACGCSLPAIKALLGHSSIQSTMIYATVTSEQANKVLRERGLPVKLPTPTKGKEDEETDAIWFLRE